MEQSDKPINHPCRYKPLQYFDYHCTAATPPSKGGESNMNLLNFNIKTGLPLLFLPGEELDEVKINDVLNCRHSY